MSDNPVAIVTGGSRGVGAATAKILSENGWNVIITCSSSIEDAKLVAANCSNKATEVFAFQADVANDKAVHLKIFWIIVEHKLLILI